MPAVAPNSPGQVLPCFDHVGRSVRRPPIAHDRQHDAIDDQGSHMHCEVLVS